MKLIDAVTKALLLNELSGNTAAAYRLSAAEGGTSGWSFGITQLDVSNNPSAAACLKECGFTAAEIARIKAKEGDRHAFDARLAAHAATIDKYDQAQVRECLDHVFNVAKSRRIEFANDAAIVHAADYHNQFYMSTNGKMANALVKLGRPVNGLDILTAKLAMKWGQEHPEDVRRRYANIVKITSAQQG